MPAFQAKCHRLISIPSTFWYHLVHTLNTSIRKPFSDFPSTSTRRIVLEYCLHVLEVPVVFFCDGIRNDCLSNSSCVRYSELRDQMIFRNLQVPPKNGLEPLKFFEPLNGVIFTTSTKKVLNTILIYTTHMAMMFLAMWSNFTMLSKTQILDASVMIITLEVGTSPILHLLILTPLSRASKFYVAIPRRIFFNDCEKCR